MSFSTNIKNEIANSEDLKKCCKKAQLSALIQLTSSLSISNQKMQLVTRSENPTVAKRIVYLVKKLYKAKTNIYMALTPLFVNSRSTKPHIKQAIERKAESIAKLT